MGKKHFVIQLHPSRPDFATIMSAEEKAIMQAHVGYWMDYMHKGVMLVFGPVLDPKGGYGLGILEIEEGTDVQVLLKNDPAARLGHYEFFPMMAVTQTTITKP